MSDFAGFKSLLRIKGNIGLHVKFQRELSAALTPMTATYACNTYNVCLCVRLRSPYNRAYKRKSFV